MSLVNFNFKYIFMRKFFLLFFAIGCCFTAFGQSAEVNGFVFAKGGERLPGVTVSLTIDGSPSNSLLTNGNGEFSFKSLQAGASYTLTASHINYEQKVLKGIVSADLNHSLSVELTPLQNSMEDVVVIGYGEVKKKDLTGAVSRVSGDDFKNIPVQRVDQMLQGRMPGVQVTSVDGSPGAGTTIRIRGSRSINASNEPLYVIDGIIDAGDLSTVNPEDIESIDVLKDASAAAIYGSRGSNGVIIITTKQGKAGRDRFNFSVNYGQSKIARYVDMMKAPDFIDFVNEAYTNSGQPEPYPNKDSILAIVGPEGTDWQKEVMQTGRFASYNISASGGTDKMTYRLSGNIIDQKGIALNSGYKRYQAKLNLNKKFTDHLKMGLNLNIARYKRTAGANIDFGTTGGWNKSPLTLPPTMLPREADGTPTSFNPTAYFGGSVVNTALAQAEMITDYTTYNDLLGNVFLQYDFLKDFSFKSSLGVHLANSTRNRYMPSYLPTNIASNTQYGNALSTFGFQNYLLNENTLTYNKQMGKHSLNVLAGFTYQNNVSTAASVSGGGLTNDIVEWNDFASIPQDQRTISSNYNENKQVAVLGRIQYNYASKYYLTFTNRYDGASNFAEDKKSAYFPSFAVKWRLANEDFLKNAFSGKVLSDMSVRFSYGLSGNQGIANYQSLASVATDANSYSFGGVPALGYVQGNIANNMLTWETSAQLNTGIDIELFKGRLSFTSNYYNTRTKDLLLTVQLPTQTGYATRLINLGKTMSRGFEFGLSGDVIRNKDFQWKTSLSISTNKQEVLDLGPLVMVELDKTGYGASTNFMEVGVPLGANFGLQYAGVWHNEDEIDAELAKPEDQRTFVSIASFYKPGKQKYYDYNHDGVLNIDDYHYLGTPNPPLYGGLGNTLTYKKLSVDFFLEFQNGSTMWNYMQYFTGVGLYLTNQMAYMKDRWTVDNPNSDIPAVNSRDNIPSTYFLQNSSFLRLKSATVSYDISSLVFKNSQNKLDLFVSGTNLFLITKYNGYDPEVNTGGTSSTIRSKDNGAYPSSRTITLGANLNF